MGERENRQREIQKWNKKEEPRECGVLNCVGKRSWGKGSQVQGLERFRVGVELRSAESSLDSPIGTCWRDWRPESALMC